MTLEDDSIVTVDVRTGNGWPIQIPRPSPRPGPPVLPGPDWNGIPGYPGGDCQPNLIVNLRLDFNFRNIEETIRNCINHNAFNAAGEEMARQNPETPRGELGNPPEDRVNHYSNLPWVIEECIKEFICPILRQALAHHERCNHDLIVVHLPNAFAVEIMELDCWNEFSKALDNTGVTWFPVIA
jgi:hypothetical protein